jgi:hypothetical protein
MKKKALASTLIFILSFVAGVGAFFVKSTQANPIINVYNDISPPEGTQAPIITIYTPINGSSYPQNVTLSFDVVIPQTNGDKSLDGVTIIYYKGSWETSQTTVAERCQGSFSVDLSDVRGGNLSVTIYAVGEGLIETGEVFREEESVLYSYHYFDRFELVGFSSVIFVKDLVPPRITVSSPKDVVYTSSEVLLDFTVSEVASEILYSLDGKENQTTAGSLTLTNLSEGAHNVTLYVADLAGNAAVPQTIFFSVDLLESFTFVFIAASIIIIVVVVAVFLLVRKHKH